uniref:Interfer-bind domain-containing protein n=1 Tax=Heterorhabditis bacteriophora TaxID=37862 RepID=A0A1I7XFH2_HETBA
MSSSSLLKADRHRSMSLANADVSDMLIQPIKKKARHNPAVSTAALAKSTVSVCNKTNTEENTNDKNLNKEKFETKSTMGKSKLLGAQFRNNLEVEGYDLQKPRFKGKSRAEMNMSKFFDWLRTKLPQSHFGRRQSLDVAKILVEPFVSKFNSMTAPEMDRFKITNMDQLDIQVELYIYIYIYITVYICYTFSEYNTYKVSAGVKPFNCSPLLLDSICYCFITYLCMEFAIDISGGVLQCHSNQYSCESTCLFDCVTVRTCDHRLNGNIVCIPDPRVLISVALLCSILLLFSLCITLHHCWKKIKRQICFKNQVALARSVSDLGERCNNPSMVVSVPTRD